MKLEYAIISALFAFCISFLLTPATIPLCKLLDAIDMPDNRRKINTVPIPRLGGLGFFFASLIVLLPYAPYDRTTGAILAGGAILMAGGIADDTFDIPPRLKLAVQTAAALIAMMLIEIPDELTFFGLLKIKLVGVVGFIIALLRLVFTVNAVNFSDGLDGLASGLSATALLSLSAYGAAAGNTVPSLAAFVLAFATFGFMPFNRYKAKVFMGDCGSQFLGLSIALLSLGNSPNGNFTLETALFLFVPTVDTTLAVIRRVLKGKSPFSADKGHLHHALLSAGVPHPYATKTLVSLSALVAAITLIFSSNQ